jgi:Domain of unknown function (DUF4304)
MTDITRAVSAVIRTALAPSLKADGYRATGNRFHRSTSLDCVQVVEIQTSRQRAGKFTMNLGIWACPIQQLIDWLPRRAVPAAHECVIRRRIGSLLPKPHDLWWTIGSEEEQASSASDVLAVWSAVGAPFLEALPDWRAVREYLLRDGQGYWPFYVHLLDHKFAKAEAIFYRDILTSPHHASTAPRALAAAARVGLTLVYGEPSATGH